MLFYNEWEPPHGSVELFRQSEDDVIRDPECVDRRYVPYAGRGPHDLPNDV
jgi:hypothetical protein